MGLKTTVPFVLAAETVGRFRFPKAWRQRILESNGFEFEFADGEWKSFPVWDDSSRKHMTRTNNHILQETNSYKSWSLFPAEYVAIAANAVGDALVVQCTTENVSTWSHETGLLTPIDFAKLNRALSR